jgi:hypothetical protein
MAAYNHYATPTAIHKGSRHVRGSGVCVLLLRGGCKYTFAGSTNRGPRHLGDGDDEQEVAADRGQEQDDTVEDATQMDEGRARASDQDEDRHGFDGAEEADEVMQDTMDTDTDKDKDMDSTQLARDHDKAQGHAEYAYRAQEEAQAHAGHDGNYQDDDDEYGDEVRRLPWN